MGEPRVTPFLTHVQNGSMDHPSSPEQGEDKSLRPPMPIAIIGMSCRFPGDSTSPEKLWTFCAEGRSAWSVIPEQRFNRKAFYHPQSEKRTATNVLGGHFLTEDLSFFDASFFNLSSEVASTMDFQCRLQLESTYEALENAGIPLGKASGTETSVFTGAFFRDYMDSYMRDPGSFPRYIITGNSGNMLSNRISHFFDLRGPSMTVDTGCSSGLVALHLGCRSLQTGESKMAIVGGANVILNPDNFILMSNLGFLSADGKSYAFDSRASGYGRGEGVSTVIVKLLKDALRDGDPIRAVIKNTAINQDGKTQTISSPSQTAQEELIRKCYREAGIEPSSAGYVEAHGTGTQAGDVVEAGAIAATLGQKRSLEQPLFIGSVKTNIGHLEPVSGFAAILKVALALEKGSIPPSINFEIPNEAIPLEHWNLAIPKKLEPWPSGYLRRASVNNFGYGGTNAHVIIESPTLHDLHFSRLDDEHKTLKHKSRVFVLSAKDEIAARSMTSNLKTYLRDLEDLDQYTMLDNLAYTLGQRRSIFPWIVATPAESKNSLIDAFDYSTLQPTRSLDQPRLGFVFTGQGAQWYAMGRELIKAYPIFEESLCEADKYLRDFGASWSLMDELMKDQNTSLVNDAILSPPLCVAVQISLVRLLSSWNVKPTAVTSHSSGEVAAAYTAGVIDLQEAMAIVYSRGIHLEALRKKSFFHGGMIAVGLGRESAKSYISTVTSGQAVVACVNSPSSTTLSGDLVAIEELEAKLTSDNVFVRRLKVDVAYHSNHMKPLKDGYLKSLRKALKQNGSFGEILYYSPVTGGRVMSATDIGPEHWVKNMLEPVQFFDALHNMCIGNGSPESRDETQVDMLVEIGPHNALAGPIRQALVLPELKDKGIQYRSCLTREKDAVGTMQALVCSLLCIGCPVDLGAVNFPRGETRLDVINDLPCYPWTHQVRHWTEPRLNKAHRLRAHPHHDLLGSPEVGGNSLAPTWRHIIRPSEVPWVHDHLVQSDIVYPGAGFISMAIEALHQISQSKVISGYRLQEIDITKALVIPNSSHGVEVQLSLRDYSSKYPGKQGWHEFHVYSTNEENTWTEHCKGLISLEAKPVKSSSRRLNGFSPNALSDGVYDSLPGSLVKNLNPENVYNNLKAVGVYHGPSFRNLTSIKFTQGHSISNFVVADTASLMPAEYEHSHVIHPTTLDSVFQSVYSTLPGAGSQNSGAMIPRFIQSMYVSHEISSNSGHRFIAHSALHRHNSRSFDSSVFVRDELGSLVLTVDGLSCQSVGRTTVKEVNVAPKNMVLTVQWDHDLLLNNSAGLKQSLICSPDPLENAIVVDIRRACFHFIYDSLSELTDSDVQKMLWHHRRFYTWMSSDETKTSFGLLGSESDKWASLTQQEKKNFYSRVSHASVNGKMVCRIGNNITPILRQQVAPLELMLEDKLLYDYYTRSLRIDRSYSQIKKLIKLFAHKFPQAKVLEIGGGTGGCTQGVLEAFGEGKNHPRLAHYDFTDISSGFFEMAREKFSAWRDLMSFEKFDVETDPETQGFEKHSYDLIIACQVLHATKAMDVTLKNVRTLLKPGGVLLMVETTQDVIDMQLVFGVLPGWWLSEEEERKSSPSLSVDSWDRVLRRTGFTGLDVQVQDCEDPSYVMSVMMSVATSTVCQNFEPEVVLVHEGVQPPAPWLNGLKTAMKAATGHEPIIEKLNDVQGNGRVCIFLDDAARPILSRIDPLEFDSLRNLLTSSDAILWVSHGGTMDCEMPEAALHTGLLRTLRCENTNRRYVSLDLDSQPIPWTSDATRVIVDVYKKSFDYSLEQNLIEVEYNERNLLISVPRIFENSAESEAIAVNFPAKQQQFYQDEHETRLEVQNPGELESLVLKEYPVAVSLPADFVEIKPVAFGLNFRDVMVALGQLDSTIMGFECSGIVTKVGAKVDDRVKVGARVCSLLRGHWANSVHVHWTSVIPIPDDMTFEVAASIPVAFVTAHYSLFDLGHLCKGETVLIHSAAWEVGQAAIMFAQHVEARIFVTVDSKEKRDFLIKNYDIPLDHIFSDKDSSFAAKVMDKTYDKGVDVVLNSLAGQLLHETWKCVARFGRFIAIGKQDLEQNNNLEMAPFARSVSFSSVDIIALGDLKGDLVAEILVKVMLMLKEKAIRPVSPITTYSVSDLYKAFRLVETGKYLGKVIIQPHQDELVKVLPRREGTKLPASASYVVVGGLGGIGRSACQWLVEHGAKNIILLSRNAKSQANASFLGELRNFGAKIVAENCDVADKLDLARAMVQCQEMPSVKGVIQGAMVLQDSVFEKMSFVEFRTALRPKLEGSWNLHVQFSKSHLDFFIMLSSVAGVAGNSSQANYAAGSSFQDALARHRAAQGLPAVSIDLGMVRSVGYVAETKGVADRLMKSGYQFVEEEEVLQLIEAAITKPIRKQHSSQILIGVASGVVTDWALAPWRRDRRFAGLLQAEEALQAEDSTKDEQKNALGFKGQLANAKSWDEAVNHICTAIVTKISEMFSMPESEIDKTAALARYGIDSLVAIELRNWLSHTFQGQSSIFDVMQSSSLIVLATKTALKSKLVDPAFHPSTVHWH